MQDLATARREIPQQDRPATASGAAGCVVKIAVGTTNRAKLASVETAAGQMFSAHSVWPCAADRSGATIITFHTPFAHRQGFHCTCCRCGVDFATAGFSQRRERSTDECR